MIVEIGITPPHSIMEEADKHDWPRDSTLRAIELFRNEFWKEPATFSELLEVLE